MKLIVIGATGLVGTNLVKLLEKSEFVFDKICFVASIKSRNKMMKFRNKYYFIKTVNDIKFSNYTHAVTLTSSVISKQIIPSLLFNNLVVIDNSSAYRNVSNLTVPEINFISNKRLYINPNCCVIQSVIPLFYINKLYDITEISYNTYQSCSGAGVSLLNRFINNEINRCVPLIGDNVLWGNSSEEDKLINETKKLLCKDINISANCVRVPVGVGHLVNVVFKANCNLDQVYNILTKHTIYQTDVRDEKWDITDDYNIYTYRLKQIGFNKYSFYTYANNLLRGASYNTFLTLKYIICNNE